MIFWRRRLPGRAAMIFGRSHLTFSLRTRDPKWARQLSRRLAVYFDETFRTMEQVTKTLTNEQRDAILQSFRDLIRERLELRNLISSVPSEAQQIERLRHAPTSLEELNARFAKEESALAADPAARAVFEERQVAHEAIAELGNLDELKAIWTDALERNDTNVVMPLLSKVLEKQDLSIPPNSLALLKLKRDSIQAGLAVLEETTQSPRVYAAQDVTPIVRLIRVLQDVVGFGVTIPQKIAICPLVNELLTHAGLVGSVNLVRREANGRLVGGNLDGAGFIDGASKAA
jgi:hypothetical protein